MQNRLANTPTSRLFSGIVSDAEELVQEQFALFKAEIKDELREAKRALPAVIAGVGALIMGAFLMCFALVYLLNMTGLQLWACFAIVAAVIGAAGGIALAVGLQRLSKLTPIADESVHELKENVRWLTKPN